MNIYEELDACEHYCQSCDAVIPEYEFYCKDCATKIDCEHSYTKFISQTPADSLGNYTQTMECTKCNKVKTFELNLYML